LSTSIPVGIKTKLMLKEIKIKLEKELNQELTWDEFFNLIELKITKNTRGRIDEK